MDIATALAIAARSMREKESMLLPTAQRLQGRRPEPPMRLAGPATRDFSDDSGNESVLLTARANLTRTIALLRIGT